MEFWSNIINTAMIGTDKKPIDANELSPAFTSMVEVINRNELLDKEERFLQIASLALNYRQAGVRALFKEEVDISKAPDEEKTYCSEVAQNVLREILLEENKNLLRLWLQLCVNDQKIVSPAIIPVLFAAVAYQKDLQPLIAACCGKRGEWLGQFNTAWNFSTGLSDEETWNTGTTEARKNLLGIIREKDPKKGREWLQQVWSQEDANTRTIFLEKLSINISEDDLPFLESLSTEKSKKVKDQALNLLKQIPSSAILMEYQQLLQQSVTLKKEKALLGMVSKMVLHFQLPSSINEAVLKSGIEKLSSTKEFTDDEFIIYQLIQSVPLAFWEKHFETNPENVINYFQKDSVGKKMIPAMINSVGQFRDTNWAIYLMQYSQTFYIDIIPLLPLRQQEHYSNSFFEKYPENIIEYALQRETEWSIELTRNILRYLANNPYKYTRSFYGQVIHLIPTSIAGEMGKFTPSNENLRNNWTTLSDYLVHLLTLKTQTIKAFKE